MKSLNLRVSLLSTLILGSFVVPVAAQVSNLDEHSTVDIAATKLTATKHIKLMTTLAVQAAAANQSGLANQLFTQSLEIAQNLPADEFGREQISQKMDLMAIIALHMARAGQTRQAERVFAQAEQLGFTKLDRWERDARLGEVAVREAEAGSLGRAMRLAYALFPDNESESVYGRATVLNNIVSVLIETGQLELAKQTLPEALTLAQTIAEDAGYESNGGCSRYRYEMLVAIAKNLTKLEQLQQALDVVQTVSSCSSASGEGGNDYQEIGMSGVISALTTPQALMQVEAALPRLSSEYAKERSRFEIAIKLSEAGEPDSAQQVAQQINNAMVRDFALLSVTAFSLPEGDDTQAQQLISQAQRLNQTYPNYWDGDRAWGDIGVNLVDAGHTDLALQVAASQPYAVNRIAARLAEVEPQQALTLIASIQDERTWQAVIPHIDDVETLNRAFEIVQTTPVDAGWSTEQIGRVRSGMLLPIAQQLAKIGQVTVAQQVAEAISEQAQKVQALSSIATHAANVASR